MSRRKCLRSLALLLAFAVAQVYIQLSLADPTPFSQLAAPPQQFMARLSTSGGPVTVNGISTPSGGTLLTGVTIETPDSVSATIDLGALGTVQLQENSSIQLEFAKDGTVRIKVLRGCVGIKKKGAGEGEVYTAEGASEKTNSKRKGMAFCYAVGGLSAIGVAGGIGAAATAGIVTTAIAVPLGTVLVVRGKNASPSAPAP